MITSEFSSQNQNNDEIDLIELVRVLWAKKLWIIFSTFVFTLIAVIYAVIAKEQWTSKAEIISPRASDLGEYLIIRKEYARILGSGLDTGELAGSLLSQFNKLAYSIDEREKYLKTSEVYQINSQDKDEDGQRELLNELARENIKIDKPDAKKNPDAIGNIISFSAETPKLAQETLIQLINSINSAAFQKDLQDFLVFFNEKMKDLNFEKSQIELNLGIQRNVQLENLHKAFETAQKADIKEYSKVLDSSNLAIPNFALGDTKLPISDSKLSDGTYLFMLGEKYLQAQIDVINSQEVIYPPRYYEISEELQQLTPLLEKIQNIKKVNSFSYLSSPNYPTTSDTFYKKIFIVFLSMVVGVLFSSVGLVINFYLRKR